jgi:hypothetical protein
VRMTSSALRPGESVRATRRASALAVVCMGGIIRQSLMSAPCASCSFTLRHAGADDRIACVSPPHGGLRLQHTVSIIRRKQRVRRGVFARREFILGAVFSAALAVGAYAPSAGQSPTVSRTRAGTNCADSYSHWMFEADSAAASPGAGRAGASSATARFILTDVSPSASVDSSKPDRKPDGYERHLGATPQADRQRERLRLLWARRSRSRAPCERAGQELPESRPLGDGRPSKAPQLASARSRVSGGCSR